MPAEAILERDAFQPVAIENGRSIYVDGTGAVVFTINTDRDEVSARTVEHFAGGMASAVDAVSESAVSHFFRAGLGKSMRVYPDLGVTRQGDSARAVLSMARRMGKRAWRSRHL